MTRLGATDSGTIKLYINGQRITSTGQIDNRTAAGTDNLTIGSGCTNGTDRSFDGKIDEVKIYNRVLTDDEVKAMYAIADGC